MNTEELFHLSDREDFRENVIMLLQQGAAHLRSVEPPAYVERCRRLWKKTKVDKLYSKRLILDDIVSDGSDDLSCVAVALFHIETDVTGTQWREPKDYLARRKPLGKERRELIFIYPTGALRPEADVPEPSVQMVALFDVLGFEAKLHSLGLHEMHLKYQEIIHRAFLPSVAEDKFAIARGMFAGQWREGYLRLPIRFAYFSDTLLIWAPFHNAFVGTFLDRCSSLFCNALRIGFPLRGAISVGEVILHKKSNTFLGEPLVEAARLEAAQDAIGVALGISVRVIGFPPDRVQKFEPPVKVGKYDLLSGLVLDWPRHWRDFCDGFAVEKLQELRAEGFSKYYDSAIDFVQYSEMNAMWFVPELEAQIGPFTVVEGV